MRTAALLLAALLAAPAAAQEVGRVGVDWVGNDIIVEAFRDPKVPGVTCHLAYFERSLIDRLSQGNWFEDPSNSSIACRQTGPITIGDIDRSEVYAAEEAFFCGSGAEVTPVVSLDRYPLGDGAPGPLTRRIQRLYFDVAEGRIERYRHWLTPVYRANA